MASFKIHFSSFIIAFAFGMFFVYINTPKPKIVIKYPTPDNASNVTYQDPAKNCYKYEATKVECSNNSVKQPVSL
jgi:hypothetical protein